MYFQELVKVGFKSLYQYRQKSFVETQEFISNIDGLFKKNLSLSIANACTSNRYLTGLTDYIVNANIIYHLINAHSSLILFVDTDEDAILYQTFFNKNGIKCNVQKKRPYYLLKILKSSRNTGREFWWFLKNILYLKCKRKVLSYSFDKTPLTLVITWINTHSFVNGEAKYKNSPLIVLLESLRNNMPIKIFGKVLSGEPKFKEIITKGLKNSQEHIFLEDFLTVYDLVKSYIQSFQILKFRKNKYSYRSIDFSCFVAESFSCDFLSGRYLNALINFCAFQRLVSKIPNGSQIIYPFENQPWERALLLARKLIDKQINCVAHQFFPLPRNLSIHRFSKIQKNLDLLPNAILTSDKFSDHMLQNENMKTLPLGNLRYDAEIQSSEPVYSPKDPFIILCCLFLDDSEAIEISCKAIQVSKMIGCDLWINCHPLLDLTTLKKIENLCLGCSTIKIVHQPAQELLKDVSVVLYNSSSVCYDAALRGVPIIFVESEILPNLDRFHSLGKSFRDIEDGMHLINDLMINEEFYQVYSHDVYTLAKEKIIPLNIDILN